jgi:hypothetical protein
MRNGSDPVTPPVQASLLFIVLCVALSLFSWLSKAGWLYTFVACVECYVVDCPAPYH